MSINAKSCFEFTLQDIKKLPGKIYSPPFATSFDTFWQLKFKPTSQEYPEHCSVYLVALPNQEEANTTSTWIKRAVCSADIYVKDPRTFLELQRKTLDMTKFSAIKPLRGWNRFCKKSSLQYDEVILGVEFEIAEFQSNETKPTFPGNKQSFPADLLQAWEDQLNKHETADVEFRVQDHSIYANTAILSKRSEYFKAMFEGKWIESVAYNKNSQKQHRHQPLLQIPFSQSTILPSLQEQEQVVLIKPDTSSSKSSYISGVLPQLPQSNQTYELNCQEQPDKTELPPHKRKRVEDGENEITSVSCLDVSLSNLILASKPKERIIIEVSDFHQETFSEMLRYLYTNQVTFTPSKDSPRSAVNMYKIADKYLIGNLQQIAKVKLCKSINIQNAAEFLFGTAWQYEELKEHVMNYVVANFKSVCKTPGFKNITSSPTEYPYFGELLNEILREVFSDGESEYSDS